MKEKELDLSGFDEAVNEDELDLSVFDEVVGTKKESIMDDVPDEVKNPLIGAAIGKGIKESLKKSTKPLEGIAEDLAYAAVGGESTATGRKFLKDQLSQLGDLPENAITTRTLGRRALNEGLVDILPNSGKIFDKSEDALLESINKKNIILSGIDKNKRLEDISRRMKADLEGKIDLELGGEDDEKLLKGLNKESERLKGSRSLSDLESAKVKTQNSVVYKPGIEPIGRSEEKLRKSKAKALRQLVEEGVSEEGSDVLKQFTDNKKDIGERGILRNMLLDKSYKDSVSPTIGFRDLATTGIGGPALTATDKIVRKKGAAVGSKLTDLMSKLGKSKIVDKLPIIGAGIGAAMSYNEAKAAGMDTPEAIGEAIKEEGIDTVLGFAAPEKIGREPEEDIFHKIARGEKISPEEMKQVRQENPEGVQQVTEQMVNSENKGVQNFGEQLKTIGTGGEADSDASKLFQLQQQPAFRELMRRQSINKDKTSPQASQELTDTTQGQDPTEIINKNIDRVATQIGSGEETPINQIDALLGSLDGLDVDEEKMDEIQRTAVNMKSVDDGEYLKKLLRDIKKG